MHCTPYPIGLYDTRLEIHLSNDARSSGSNGDRISGDCICGDSQHAGEAVHDSHDGLHAVLLTRLSCASPRGPSPLSTSRSCPSALPSAMSASDFSTPYRNGSLTCSWSCLPNQHSASCCFALHAADTHADLTAANLTTADLTTADLTTADLTTTDLMTADLTTADLTTTDLMTAELTTADLTTADPLASFHPPPHRHHDPHHSTQLPLPLTPARSSPCPRMAHSGTCASGVRMELQVMP